jgi:hypothetical protein
LGDQIRDAFGFDGGEIKLYYDDSMMDDEMRVCDLGDIGDAPIVVKVKDPQPRAAPPEMPPAAPLTDGKVKVWFDGLGRTFAYTAGMRICDLEPEIRAWRSVPAARGLRFLRTDGVDEEDLDRYALLGSVDWSSADLRAEIDDSPPIDDGSSARVEPPPGRARVSFVAPPEPAEPVIQIEYHFLEPDPDGPEGDSHFQLTLASTATVADAKERIAKKYPMTSRNDVSLLFHGKLLKDGCRLNRLRIGNKEVVVTVNKNSDFLINTAMALQKLPA